MCGIAGIVRRDGAEVDPQRLWRMGRAIEHRGPDDADVWVEGPFGLSHRRLSIIDLAGSPQPMSSTDGQLTIAFNGEILNYSALRSELAYPWRTSGDTEVVLASHRVAGREAPGTLVGQFAYALHDRADDSLLLVRDRLGVLPLYIGVWADEVVFASEPKAILAVRPDAHEVDHDQLERYLAGRSVPAPDTMFRHIKKVLPGHSLRITTRGPDVQVPYWQPAPWTGADPRWSGVEGDAAAVSAVRATLTNAVDRALVADVPVGAYLSGGLDSSLIVALASAARPGVPLHTFAAGFGDPRTDELSYAAAVSRHLGTVHHPVSVSASDFTEQWESLTWHRDAPISEPADVAVARLAGAAREHVKVVLSGEGSDELFGGYPKYRAARAVSALDVLPAPMRRRVADAVEALAPRRARAVLRAVAAPGEAERFVEWFAPVPADVRVRLTGAPIRARAPYAGRVPHGDLARRMSVHDLGWWLSDNLLERGDRMTMSRSVELRPPFLDAEVVDLALSLPGRVKVRGGTTKWVVKQVAAGLVPAETVSRPKAGFKVPLNDWFRGDLRDLARDRLLSADSFVSNSLDAGEVRRLLERHDSGRRDEAIGIWTLLSLETWHRVFLRAPAAT